MTIANSQKKTQKNWTELHNNNNCILLNTKSTVYTIPDVVVHINNFNVNNKNM